MHIVVIGRLVGDEDSVVVESAIGHEYMKVHVQLKPYNPDSRPPAEVAGRILHPSAQGIEEDLLASLMCSLGMIPGSTTHAGPKMRSTSAASTDQGQTRREWND